MYPFYYGPGIGTASLEADDIAIASTMYPEAGYLDDIGTISGTIYAPNGATKLTGVNVIARNVADPFFDAVSAISSDFTDSTAQSDPVVGTYTINGLTPGGEYAVYVDEILAGGFSTPLSSPLIGPEEFYSADESSSDDPSVFTAITAVAGIPAAGTDIIFNQPGEGDPLPVGDRRQCQSGAAVHLLDLRPGVRLGFRQRQRQPDVRKRRQRLLGVGQRDALRPAPYRGCVG